MVFICPHHSHLRHITRKNLQVWHLGWTKWFNVAPMFCWFALQGHRTRNEKTARMFTICLAFIVFCGVSFSLQVCHVYVSVFAFWSFVCHRQHLWSIMWKHFLVQIWRSLFQVHNRKTSGKQKFTLRGRCLQQAGQKRWMNLECEIICLENDKGVSEAT